MPLLLQLFLQGRQGLLDLCQRGLLCRHVRVRNLAEGPLPSQYHEEVGRELDDLPCRRDLAAQRRLLHGRDDDIRGERQVGRFKREPLNVGLSLQRFDGPARQAEDVRCIGDADLAGEQVEGRLRGLVRRRTDRGALATSREAAVDAWKEILTQERSKPERKQAEADEPGNQLAAIA